MNIFFLVVMLFRRWSNLRLFGTFIDKISREMKIFDMFIFEVIAFRKTLKNFDSFVVVPNAILFCNSFIFVWESNLGFFSKNFIHLFFNHFFILPLGLGRYLLSSIVFLFFCKLIALPEAVNKLICYFYRALSLV